jgi:hypothetical protein
MTDEQFRAIVRELRIVQIILAIMVVILIFIAGWLQPWRARDPIQAGRVCKHCRRLALARYHFGWWFDWSGFGPIGNSSSPCGGTISCGEGIGVVRAAAGGYTLLLVSPANTINATLYEKLNYNFIRDIAPVAGLARVANALVVHPSVPAKTVPDFIAYARGPIRARSTWRPAATEPRPMWPASCSRW